MNSKNWGNLIWDYPSKLKSREKILQTWNKVSGLSSIPKERIFYTLGGRSTDSNKFSPASWSEHTFLIKRKVITSKQYYSVEKKEDVFVHNKDIRVGNWIKGDFVEKLRTCCEHNKLPAIINFDAMGMAKTVYEDFGKILRIVDCYDIPNVFLCCNVMLQAHHYKDSPENALHILQGGEDAMWYFGNDKLKKKWKILKPYMYQGGTRTPMCNFMFYQK
jgi:hypothetical protein